MTRLALALLVAVATLAAPVATAAISITAPTSASTSVTLNGLDQTATFTVTFAVGSPGTGGWHINAWAARPAAGSGTLGMLTVDSEPTSTCFGRGCVDAATSGLSWPLTLGTSSGSAVKIFNAAKKTGTGSNVAVDVPFSVAVPASTLTGAYTTTLNVAVATGP